MVVDAWKGRWSVSKKRNEAMPEGVLERLMFRVGSRRNIVDRNIIDALEVIACELESINNMAKKKMDIDDYAYETKARLLRVSRMMIFQMVNLDFEIRDLKQDNGA